ncbi:winged helix-turn-helix transcriptional regulator [Gemella cuniculi]|uniref:winged helix-turn-helix transcriptional regulator n=1 Tax=Gemella cuniculi TaxID=150240 RepID=UPI00040165D7|nr:helix-turn-helix domain-containing protein [Gemella cuniculi]
MENKELFGVCPFFTTQKILTGKWTILILHILSNKEKRFNELQRELGNITQATLTKQLKQLERDGLINRKVYAQIPPKVEYSLTDIGKKFQKVLNELENWGTDYIEHLRKSKDAM